MFKIIAGLFATVFFLVAASYVIADASLDNSVTSSTETKFNN